MIFIIQYYISVRYVSSGWYKVTCYILSLIIQNSVCYGIKYLLIFENIKMHLPNEMPKIK